jgi:hypothetical protein
MTITMPGVGMLVLGMRVGALVAVTLEVGSAVVSTSVGCGTGVAVTTRTVAVAVGIGTIVIEGDRLAVGAAEGPAGVAVGGGAWRARRVAAMARASSTPPAAMSACVRVMHHACFQRRYSCQIVSA